MDGGGGASPLSAPLEDFNQPNAYRVLPLFYCATNGTRCLSHQIVPIINVGFFHSRRFPWIVLTYLGYDHIPARPTNTSALRIV